MLAEIEQALTAEDPRFAQRAARVQQSSSVGFNLRSIALMLLGLVMLVGGIALAQHSLWFVILSVVGFLVMFAGGLLAFRGGNRPAAQANVSSLASAGRRPKARSGGIGDRMEQSFRRRFE